MLAGMFSAFAIVTPALLIQFWKMSATMGWMVFTRGLWYEVLLQIGVFGTIGVFALKVANRTADMLLGRFGFK